MGRIRIDQIQKRMCFLKRIHDAFCGFEHALSEYRIPPMEYFEKNGVILEELFGEQKVDGLLLEDRERLSNVIDAVRKLGYQEALNQVRDYSKEITVLIKALEGEIATSGKALPLVTGTIGFLVAVFLF